MFDKIKTHWIIDKYWSNDVTKKTIKEIERVLKSDHDLMFNNKSEKKHRETSMYVKFSIEKLHRDEKLGIQNWDGF